MERRRRRFFSKEFKLEAIRLITEGKRPVSQVARELDVKPERLREWRRQFAPELAAAPRSESEELARVRRQLATTQQELAFLKKAAAYFASGPR